MTLLMTIFEYSAVIIPPTCELLVTGNAMLEHQIKRYVFVLNFHRCFPPRLNVELAPISSNHRSSPLSLSTREFERHAGATFINDKIKNSAINGTRSANIIREKTPVCVCVCVGVWNAIFRGSLNLKFQ